jgi:hypothetical protein
MPASSLTKSPVQKLSLLRYAVLLDLEEKPYGIDSKGLGSSGQGDLTFIFPRTARLAALTHAGRVAAQVFDSRIRDLGFYHLFRLPTYWEARIHSALREPDGFPEIESSRPLDLLATVTGEEAEAGKGVEGATNLGALDLDSPNDIKKLARAHANAIAAGKLVIPFFTLNS